MIAGSLCKIKNISKNYYNLTEIREIEGRGRLLSEEGKEIYNKRKIEVETVFGIIKNNKGFRRFLLRGLKGVNLK